MHQRFARCAVARFAGQVAESAAQIAIEIAAHGHHRMRQKMDGDFAAVEFVGDRIDQERHVVVRDLHDRAAALEAMVGVVGIEHANLGDAGQAAAGERQKPDRGRAALLGRGGSQILIGDPFIEPAGKLGGILAAGKPKRRHADRVQTIGLGAVRAGRCRRHKTFPSSLARFLARLLAGAGCYAGM